MMMLRSVGRVAAMLLAGTCAVAAQGGSLPQLSFVPAGTGFIVSSRGYIVTAPHVLETCLAPSFRYGGKLYNAPQVAVSGPGGIALLRINTQQTLAAQQEVIAPPLTEADVATLVEAAPIPVGTPAYVYGYPDPVLLDPKGVFLTGRVSLPIGDVLTVDPRLLKGVTTQMISLDVRVADGTAGGPVLGPTGAVIGLQITTAPADVKPDRRAVPAIGTAVPSLDLITFLRANNVRPVTALAVGSIDSQRIAAIAARISGRIECGVAAPVTPAR
jgi:S1-C subfamily serine protease